HRDLPPHGFLEVDSNKPVNAVLELIEPRGYGFLPESDLAANPYGGQLSLSYQLVDASLRYAWDLGDFVGQKRSHVGSLPSEESLSATTRRCNRGGLWPRQITGSSEPATNTGRPPRKRTQPRTRTRS